MTHTDRGKHSALQARPPLIPAREEQPPHLGHSELSACLGAAEPVVSESPRVDHPNEAPEMEAPCLDP
ncbi:hypothetical protein AVEN_79286-1 [Araneus ventricosus]|uniref:Uncharacterized protein n=1 Tax=Araneus ventricosus TaxID=182803 RepID=A0A4Y2WU33_ARAVE|nr:hypothetical protein AVEN_79286-1 [Araneus ventricosus]